MPVIITHCAPDVVVADLHTSLSGGITTSNSDASLNACGGGFSTDHSRIERVVAAVDAQLVVRTLDESGLISETVEVVHPNEATAHSEASTEDRTCTLER